MAKLTKKATQIQRLIEKRDNAHYNTTVEIFDQLENAQKAIISFIEIDSNEITFDYIFLNKRDAIITIKISLLDKLHPMYIAVGGQSMTVDIPLAYLNTEHDVIYDYLCRKRDMEQDRIMDEFHTRELEQQLTKLENPESLKMRQVISDNFDNQLNHMDHMSLTPCYPDEEEPVFQSAKKYKVH